MTIIISYCNMHLSWYLFAYSAVKYLLLCFNLFPAICFRCFVPCADWKDVHKTKTNLNNSKTAEVQMQDQGGLFEHRLFCIADTKASFRDGARRHEHMQRRVNVFFFFCFAVLHEARFVTMPKPRNTTLGSEFALFYKKVQGNTCEDVKNVAFLGKGWMRLRDVLPQRWFIFLHMFVLHVVLIVSWSNRRDKRCRVLAFLHDFLTWHWFIFFYMFILHAVLIVSWSNRKNRMLRVLTFWPKEYFSFCGFLVL